MSKFAAGWTALALLAASCGVGSASPIHVVDGDAGLNFYTDSSAISLLYGPGGTSVFFEYNVPGPDSPIETQPGDYLSNTAYAISLTSSQVITNPTNFTLSDQFIMEDDSNVFLSSYTITSAGDYIDTSQDFPISGGDLSVRSVALANAPLPAAAPMFGGALVALGAIGYGLKRKGKSAAAA